MKKKWWIAILTGLCACFMSLAFASCGGASSNNGDSDKNQTSEEAFGTEGLVYTLKEGAGYYIVTGYEGTETEVIIPSTYEGLPVKQIRGNAFESSVEITSLTLGSNVTLFTAETFAFCGELTSILVDPNNTALKSIAGNLYSKDGSTLFQYPMGKSEVAFFVPDSVTTIGEHAFIGCDSLMEIVIPDSVARIGCGAFAGCDSLTSISFEDKENWYFTMNRMDWENKTGGTEADVSDSGDNVTHFQSTYFYYYWYKI